MGDLNNKIDFVITWVDDNDPKWISERNKFSADKYSHYATNNSRFRDWDLLKYWFRGVEKNASWVNKIHFVTYGHLPNWLNINHPKLNIVKHEDFIPEQYLPTFNSHTIELNLHRIPSLSNKFVYFNDDIFILDSLEIKDFFEKDQPCDEAILHNIVPHSYQKDYAHYLVNEAGLINDNFDFKRQIELHSEKFFNEAFLQYVESNKYFAKQKYFMGFYPTHLAQSFNKETYNAVWKKEGDILHQTCLNKFRSIKDVGPRIFRNWNLINGEFYPVLYRKIGMSFTINKDSLMNICDFIIKKERKLICINDTEQIDDYEYLKGQLKNSFETIYLAKSDFEL